MRHILLFIFFFLPCTAVLAQPPKLYVFLPSPMRPHAMQARLTKSFPKWDVTVFGRFREFERQLKTATPDAIITLPVVAGEFDTFTTWASGIRSGRTDEPYVLLSVNQAVPRSSLDTTTIGAVDLLGRRKMESFLSQKLHTDNIRVRTVTKLEDLLSLLQFQDVNAVFVPTTFINYYLERSRLNLIVNDLSDTTVGLPVLSVLQNTNQAYPKLLDRLLILDDNLKKLLGVDLWQRP